MSLGVFTGKINAGRIDKDGRSFAEKSECTEAALDAVAGYILSNDGEVFFPVPGNSKKKVRLTAEVLDDDGR